MESHCILLQLFLWPLLPCAHTTSSHIPLLHSHLTLLPPPLSLPLFLCPQLSLPPSKAVVTVRLPHIIPPRWKLNEGGLTQRTQACFEGCNQGRLPCQILFHGLWICAADARTQQSLSHAEAHTTGLISPPDLWKLHFSQNCLFVAVKNCESMDVEWSRWCIRSLDCSQQHTWMCLALWRCRSCQGESNGCCCVCAWACFLSSRCSYVHSWRNYMLARILNCAELLMS